MLKIVDRGIGCALYSVWCSLWDSPLPPATILICHNHHFTFDYIHAIWLYNLISELMHFSLSEFISNNRLKRKTKTDTNKGSSKRGIFSRIFFFTQTAWGIERVSVDRWFMFHIITDDNRSSGKSQRIPLLLCGVSLAQRKKKKKKLKPEKSSVDPFI